MEDLQRGRTAARAPILPGFIQSMWFGPALAVVVAVLLSMFNHTVILAAGPLLGLWFVSPLVAWWLSRTLATPPVHLSDKQRDFSAKSCPGGPGAISRSLSRRKRTGCHRTIFRRQPAQGVASRTSPTNIGMALLANLAAYDFGYCQRRPIP